MGVHESRGNLAKAFKELMTRWAEARQGWDDVRSEQFETQYLQAQLLRFGGNISRTANFVGMERSALHRKLKFLGVQAEDRAPAAAPGAA